MLVRLFKSTQPIVYIILPIIVLLIWLGAFFFQFEVITAKSAPLYDLIVNKLTNGNRYFYLFLSIVLVVFQSFYLAHIIDKHEILEKRGYLAALLYAILIFVIPHSLIFHPVLLANTFLIWILDKFFNLYKSQKPIAESFDIGIICALATLFYLPAVYMLLAFIICVNLLLSFSWRNIVSALLGFVSIWFLVWLVYYLTNNLQNLNLLVGDVSVALGRDFTKPNSIAYIVVFSVLLLIFGSSLIDMILRHSGNTSRLRRFNQVVWIYTLISAIVVIIIFNGKAYQIALLSIPFTIIISHFLITLKKRNIDEIIVFLLLGIALYQFLL